MPCLLSRGQQRSNVIAGSELAPVWPHSCRIAPSTLRKAPRVFRKVRFDPQGSRRSSSLEALKGYRKAQWVLVVLPKCFTYMEKYSVSISISSKWVFTCCLCANGEVINKIYQPVGTHSLRMCCCLRRCPQLLLTPRLIQSGLQIVLCPLEQGVRKIKTTSRVFISSLDWWLAVMSWLLWICMWPSMPETTWRVLSVPEMVRVAPKHLHRRWWVSCSARTVRLEEITEQDGLPSGNKLTHSLHYPAFSCFQSSTTLC